MGTWHLMTSRYFVSFSLYSIIFLFSFGHIREMILPDILEWKKHVVVQTVYPIFRNSLFFAMEPISSDKF